MAWNGGAEDSIACDSVATGPIIDHGNAGVEALRVHSILQNNRSKSIGVVDAGGHDNGGVCCGNNRAMADLVNGWTGIGSDHHPSVAGKIGLVMFQFIVAVYGGYFGAGIGILMLSSLGLLGLGDVHRLNGLKTFLAACSNGVSVGGASSFVTTTMTPTTVVDPAERARAALLEVSPDAARLPSQPDLPNSRV